ncbi:MAG: DUF3307 domain-containing protein [Cytophagaceae bacterium]|nr:DUF3307 domain-containing protein [Cytophagaceae bacterium]
MNQLIDFSASELNFLVRLIIAHLLSDFVLQTKGMVQNKKWYAWGLLSHILITMGIAFLLTWKIWVVLIIGVTHYFIDISKTELTKKYPQNSYFLFIADQLAHLLVLIFVWAWYLGRGEMLVDSVRNIITDYEVSLVIMGYIFCVWPCSYIIKFTIDKLDASFAPTGIIQNGGKWIGQFERLIIFTLVLLNEYEAIGFLITGKSIIRFADREQVKSEYVLVGTMLSFALAILAGALVNWMRG